MTTTYWIIGATIALACTATFIAAWRARRRRTATADVIVTITPDASQFIEAVKRVAGRAPTPAGADLLRQLLQHEAQRIQDQARSMKIRQCNPSIRTLRDPCPKCGVLELGVEHICPRLRTAPPQITVNPGNPYDDGREEIGPRR